MTKGRMTPQAEPAGLTQFVEALLECSIPITLILDQMSRSPTRPDPCEARAVLTALLSDVLEPLATVLAPRDLRTTPAVLEAAVPMIGENLFIVPHEPPGSGRRDPRDPHRARPRPRPRRQRGRG